MAERSTAAPAVPAAAVPASPARFRPAWAEIDQEALTHNTAVLTSLVAPAGLCAVVKADGYGHGAAAAARAALGAGARGLAVALVEEGVALAEAGIETPMLLLSEPPPGAFEATLAAGITPTLCTPAGVEQAGAAARALGRRAGVQLKVDTGMHRAGAAPHELAGLVGAVADHPSLVLEGIWTHLAVADGVGAEDHDFTRRQLACYEQALKAAAGADRAPGRAVQRHAANSAAAIAWPGSRYDLVRCGIALYGELPGPMVAAAFAAAGCPPLRPALSLRARVSAVRVLEAGERPSYGRHRPLTGRAVVATVPVGYADGVPRRLFEAGGQVLVGGVRRPLAGMVTMDQLVVDCGPPGAAGGRLAADVQPGDEVTLLGRQGTEAITASDWASMLGTISYEVLCGIGARVPRVLTGEPGR